MTPAATLSSTRRATVFALYIEPLLWMGACLWGTVGVAAALRSGQTDFAAFYESGRAALAHRDIYAIAVAGTNQANLNPPPVVLLFIPFALVPFSAALGLWLLLSIAAMFAACVLINREVRSVSSVTLLSILLLSEAGFSTLRLGQIGGFLMLLVTIAWIADRHERPRVAGSALAIAIWAKLFLVPFIVYLAWRRSWRTLGWLAATAGVIAVVGLLAGGWQAYESWVTALRAVAVQAHLLNASLYGVVARNLSPSNMPVTPGALAPALVRPLWLGLSGVLVVLILAALARRPGRDREWAALLLGSVLVSPLGWTYYLASAAGPAVATIGTASARCRWRFAIGVVVLCLPLVLTASNFSLRFNALETLTVGSAYTIGALLVLDAVCRA